MNQRVQTIPNKKQRKKIIYVCNIILALLLALVIIYPIVFLTPPSSKLVGYVEKPFFKGLIDMAPSLVYRPFHIDIQKFTGIDEVTVGFVSIYLWYVSFVLLLTYSYGSIYIFTRLLKDKRNKITKTIVGIVALVYNFLSFLLFVLYCLPSTMENYIPFVSKYYDLMSSMFGKNGYLRSFNIFSNDYLSFFFYSIVLQTIIDVALLIYTLLTSMEKKTNYGTLAKTVKKGGNRPIMHEKQDYQIIPAGLFTTNKKLLKNSPFLRGKSLKMATEYSTFDDDDSSLSKKDKDLFDSLEPTDIDSLNNNVVDKSYADDLISENELSSTDDKKSKKNKKDKKSKKDSKNSKEPVKENDDVYENDKKDVKKDKKAEKEAAKEKAKAEKSQKKDNKKNKKNKKVDEDEEDENASSTNDSSTEKTDDVKDKKFATTVEKENTPAANEKQKGDNVSVVQAPVYDDTPQVTVNDGVPTDEKRFASVGDDIREEDGDEVYSEHAIGDAKVIYETIPEYKYSVVQTTLYRHKDEKVLRVFDIIFVVLFTLMAILAVFLFTPLKDFYFNNLVNVYFVRQMIDVVPVRFYTPFNMSNPLASWWGQSSDFMALATWYFIILGNIVMLYQIHLSFVAINYCKRCKKRVVPLRVIFESLIIIANILILTCFYLLCFRNELYEVSFIKNYLYDIFDKVAEMISLEGTNSFLRNLNFNLNPKVMLLCYCLAAVVIVDAILHCLAIVGRSYPYAVQWKKEYRRISAGTGKVVRHVIGRGKGYGRGGGVTKVFQGYGDGVPTHVEYTNYNDVAADKSVTLVKYRPIASVISTRYNQIPANLMPDLTVYNQKYEEAQETIVPVTINNLDAKPIKTADADTTKRWFLAPYYPEFEIDPSNFGIHELFSKYQYAYGGENEDITDLSRAIQIFNSLDIAAESTFAGVTNPFDDISKPVEPVIIIDDEEEQLIRTAAAVQPKDRATAIRDSIECDTTSLYEDIPYPWDKVDNSIKLPDPLEDLDVSELLERGIVLPIERTPYVEEIEDEGSDDSYEVVAENAQPEETVDDSRSQAIYDSLKENNTPVDIEDTKVVEPPVVVMKPAFDIEKADVDPRTKAIYKSLDNPEFDTCPVNLDEYSEITDESIDNNAYSIYTSLDDEHDPVELIEEEKAFVKEEPVEEQPVIENAQPVVTPEEIVEETKPEEVKPEDDGNYDSYEVIAEETQPVKEENTPEETTPEEVVEEAKPKDDGNYDSYEVITEVPPVVTSPDEAIDEAPEEKPSQEQEPQFKENYYPAMEKQANESPVEEHPDENAPQEEERVEEEPEEELEEPPVVFVPIVEEKVVEPEEENNPYEFDYPEEENTKEPEEETVEPEEENHPYEFEYPEDDQEPEEEDEIKDVVEDEDNTYYAFEVYSNEPEPVKEEVVEEKKPTKPVVVPPPSSASTSRKPIKPIAPIKHEEVVEEKPEEKVIEKINKPLHDLSAKKDIKITPVAPRHVPFNLKQFMIDNYDGYLTSEEAFSRGIAKVSSTVAPVVANRDNNFSKSHKNKDEYANVSTVDDLSKYRYQPKTQNKVSSTSIRDLKKALEAEKERQENEANVERASEANKPTAPIRPITPIKPKTDNVDVEKVDDATPATEEKKVPAPVSIQHRLNTKPKPVIKPVDPTKKK